MKLINSFFKIILILLFCFLSINTVFAQKSEIRLRQAKKLKGVIINGKRVNKVLGNVIFEHNKTIMHCDSAYQYSQKNEIHAFGHVKVIQKKDNVTLYGDKLIYNGNTRLAKIRKNVRLVDKKLTLTTDFLDYDMKNKKANYFEGGKIIDNEMTLTSILGYYNMKSNFYSFKDEVKVNHKDYQLVSDTLIYYTKTKITEFFGPTNIYSGTQHLYAEKGKYNTSNKKSYFKNNAKIEDDDFTLIGDSIYFDNEKKEGYAYENVSLFSKKDSVLITGNELYRWGEKGKSKVIGNSIMQKIEAKDTLYLSADILISIQDTINKNSHIEAIQNVLVWKREVQAKCDSLVYHMYDSTMQFYQKPILWNGQNQITGDTILIQLKNKTIDKLYANTSSFLISEDEDDNTHYNQIKGKNMIAHFKNGSINKVDVHGSGQSIFFAKNEDDKSLMGMNDVGCGNMIITFKNNDVDNISFLTTPDAKFIPPTELLPEEEKLKGFEWMIDQKPSIEDVLRIKKEKIIKKEKTVEQIVLTKEEKKEQKEEAKRLKKEEKKRKKEERKRKKKEQKK